MNTTTNITLPASNNIPETTIIRFKEVHTKDAIRIMVNRNKEVLFDPVKGRVKQFTKFIKSKESDTLEVNFKETVLTSYWCIEAQRKIDYALKQQRKINIDNPDATKITIKINDADLECPVERGIVNVETTEYCTQTIDYFHIFDNSTGLEYDAFQRNYIDEPNYTKQKNKKELGIILKPSISKTSLIISCNSKLTSKSPKADDILDDMISYKKIELYLVPVYIFECRESETQRSVTVKVDAVTGKIIKDQSQILDILKDDEFKNMLIDVAAEVTNAALPGVGSIGKFAVHKVMN
ncbi:hypothetical protein [Lonepinella sp. BR2474]|uniref:hypothetical protein n=1 Tax=Lonepinella sp. BR2474 TaxID=3434548 RepID=UPI003F6DDCBB